MVYKMGVEDYFYSSITAYCHKDRSFLSSIRTIVEIILKDMHLNYYSLDELINNFEHGESLNNNLDRIRKISNDYIHGRKVEVSFTKYDFDIYFKPINDLIDFAQKNRNLSYSIRYDREKMIVFEEANNGELSKQIPISLINDFGKGHNVYNKHTLKTFFKEDFVESDNLFNSDSVVISGGYFSMDSCIKFRKPNPPKSSKEENVVFKVIYNLLIRNDVIDIPDCLKAKGLSYNNLNRIYAMQCLFCYVASTLNKNKIHVYVANKDQLLFKYALENIKEIYNNYWLLLERVVDAPMYIWPEIIVDVEEDLDYCDFDLIINEEQYSIGYIEKENFISNLYLIAIKNYSLVFNESNSNIWDYFANLIFGYSGLKVGQQNILQHSLRESNYGNIPCCILPTGYGKSAIYQLTAFLMPKISFVISPTLILIRDQLNNLRDEMGNKMAKILPNKINTSCLETTALLYYSDANSLYNNENKNAFKILFKQNYLGYFNIDECHQISIWSQNFDFNYLTLTDFIINNMPGAKVVMYTATANDNVQDDLMSRFKNSRNKKSRNVTFIIAGSFERDLIEHRKISVKNDEELFEKFKEMLILELERAENDQKEHKIAFENIVVINNDINLLMKAYNYVKDLPYGDGALTIGDISVFYNSMELDAYSLFVNGLRKVMFASDEFSIGINIPSVKTIITLGTPTSKEWYYQETGRVCRLSTIGLNDNDSTKIMGHAIDIYIDDKTYQKQMSMDYINRLINYNNALYSNLCLTLDVFTRANFDVALMRNIYFHGNKLSKYYTFGSNINESYKFSTGVYLTFASGIINSYVGCIQEDNKKINYSLLYNLDYDNVNIVRSKIIEFAKLYQTLDTATKELANDTRFIANVEDLMKPFIKWYYTSLLYQVNQSFINAQVMLNDYDGNDIEKVLELTFTAKLLGKKSSNYILVGVDFGPLDDLKIRLIEYEKSNNNPIESFKDYIAFSNKKMKNITDMEVIAVLQDAISTKDIKHINLMLGYYELKNNYDPIRFMKIKHSMNERDFTEYVNILLDNLKLPLDLKEEYILSFIQVVSIDKLYNRGIINEYTSEDLLNKMKMIELIKLFGMGR